MKELLRKILRINTLKIVLYNPGAIRYEYIKSMHIYPVVVFPCVSINDVKVIDTGIVIWKKS